MLLNYRQRGGKKSLFLAVVHKHKVTVDQDLKRLLCNQKVTGLIFTAAACRVELALSNALKNLPAG